eukprot:TRINITY_DN46137_c0_g1_i1.p1 TRINITY_DN46137_c0_g1~~TRINITY_DN46137_c0_g1_i1.p1  ORF type:complete len:380 (+),score=61.44 TRINITY_DN46137_c0_g1_i1:69-1208(+)
MCAATVDASRATPQQRLPPEFEKYATNIAKWFPQLLMTLGSPDFDSRYVAAKPRVIDAPQGRLLEIALESQTAIVAPVMPSPSAAVMPSSHQALASFAARGTAAACAQSTPAHRLVPAQSGWPLNQPGCHAKSSPTFSSVGVPPPWPLSLQTGHIGSANTPRFAVPVAAGRSSVLASQNAFQPCFDSLAPITEGTLVAAAQRRRLRQEILRNVDNLSGELELLSLCLSVHAPSQPSTLPTLPGSPPPTSRPTEQWGDFAAVANPSATNGSVADTQQWSAIASGAILLANACPTTEAAKVSSTPVVVAAANTRVRFSEDRQTSDAADSDGSRKVLSSGQGIKNSLKAPRCPEAPSDGFSSDDVDFPLAQAMHVPSLLPDD